MSQEIFKYTLTPESEELKTSQAIAFSDMRKDNWCSVDRYQNDKACHRKDNETGPYTEEEKQAIYNANRFQLYQDSVQRNWTINGQHLKTMEDVNEWIEKYPALKDYIYHHSQSLAGIAQANMTEAGAKSDVYFAPTHNTYESNIHINENGELYVTTHSHFTAIFLPEASEYFMPPGIIQTTFKLTPEGIKLHEIKITNTVLKDLALGNINFPAPPQNYNALFAELTLKAQQEEMPESLYEWYKHQAKFLLDSKVQRNKSADDYSAMLQNFLSQLDKFFVTYPSLHEKFKKDYSFQQSVGKIKYPFSEPKIDSVFKNNIATRDPFSLTKNRILTAAKNYNTIKNESIDTIVFYILAHPDSAQAFFKKRPRGQALLTGINFRKALAKRPDLLEKLIKEGDKKILDTMEKTKLLTSRHLKAPLDKLLAERVTNFTGIHKEIGVVCHQHIVPKEKGGKYNHQEDRVISSRLPEEVENFSDAQMETLLKNTFKETEAQCGQESKGGSTLITSAIIGKKIYTAHVGDSEAFLVIQDKNGNLSVKRLNRRLHEPNEEGEKKRILDAAPDKNPDDLVFLASDGISWKMKGGLSVTRAIGDNDDRFISHEPDIDIIEADIPEGGKAFLIHACDGLFEGLKYNAWHPSKQKDFARDELHHSSPDDFVKEMEPYKGKTDEEYLQLLLEKHKNKTPEEMAKSLAEEAQNHGSGDNISIVITEVNDKLPPRLAGIADGHGGPQVSENIRQKFPTILKTQAEILDKQLKQLPQEIENYAQEIKQEHEKETAYQDKKIRNSIILQQIIHPKLREDILRKIEDMTHAHPPVELPSEEKIKAFVEEINKKLNSLHGLSPLAYTMICEEFAGKLTVEFSTAPQEKRPFFEQLSDLSIPADGYHAEHYAEIIESYIKEIKHPELRQHMLNRYRKIIEAKQSALPDPKDIKAFIDKTNNKLETEEINKTSYMKHCFEFRTKNPITQGFLTRLASDVIPPNVSYTLQEQQTKDLSSGSASSPVPESHEVKVK